MSFEVQGDYELPPAVVRAKDPRPDFPTRLGDSIVDFLSKVRAARALGAHALRRLTRCSPEAATRLRAVRSTR